MSEGDPSSPRGHHGPYVNGRQDAHDRFNSSSGSTASDDGVRTVVLSDRVVIADEDDTLVFPQNNNDSGRRRQIGMARIISLGKLANEGRRLMAMSSPVLLRQTSIDSLPKNTLRRLLQPTTWQPPEDNSFPLTAAEVEGLCDLAEPLFRAENPLLHLEPPVKVYGDLHGQYEDLMRLFAAYGSPSKHESNGDISGYDYLFLGDYVDRGTHSLEVICLLLALKVESPTHVHLIRGNHEAASVNCMFGLLAECCDRFGHEQGGQTWARLNALFDWMPLGAIIADRILCIHGGIGQMVKTVKDIATIQRPISVDLEGGPSIVKDLLWSDPTPHDSVEGIRKSRRGPGICTFGPDRVQAFCKENNIDMIVRAHECVMDGVERFAGGRLITVFSAANYCGGPENYPAASQQESAHAGQGQAVPFQPSR
eukprot:jgi/Mesvir1/22737/Mv14140-RA.1